MAMIRFEAWTRPDTGTFQRKFPITDIEQWSMSLGIFGQGLLVLPRDYPRLDDILFIDPANHANDKATLIRAYVGDTHLYDFYASRASIMVGEVGVRVATITGGGPGSALDRTKVRQLDYDANPSEEPDWEYGADNRILQNEGFEDLPANAFVNGDFEEGLVEPWSPVSGTDTNPLDVDLATTDTEAQAGTFSLMIDPGKRHSGAAQSVACTPGMELTLNGYLKCATVGRRFTAAVKKEDGMTFDPSNNGYVYNGWYIVELGNVNRNGSTGLPGGASDGTWQALGQIMVTPGPDTESIQYIVQYDHHDGSNGPVFYVDSFTGTGLGVGFDPWKSYQLTKMELDTTLVHSGTQCGFVGGDDGAALYQNLDGLEVGRRYTASFWVYHTAAADRDIAAQYTIPGTPSASIMNTTAVPPDEWTLIDVTFVATQPTARVETKNKSGVNLWWRVDDAKVATGFPASTYGEIMGDLLDDAATNHAPNRTALAWLVPTFTDSLDSNGDAWDADRAITISRGQPYRRVVAFMEDGFGYESTIRANPAAHTTLFLDLYNPGGMGTDYSITDGKAITGRGLVSVGPIIRREPFATYAMAEGELQRWWESRNTVTQAAWGEIEDYRSTDEISSVSLAPVVARMTDATEGETVVAKFQDPPLVPGIDYVIGDVLRLALGDEILPAAAFRVAAIDIESGDPEPVFQVQFVSEGL
jgi:hypothetical protein